MSLGQRVRERRIALDITQQELADALEVTPQHISVIEQDKVAPSVALLARLAQELGVSADYLLSGREGIITEVIPAIKADNSLTLEAKKILITLVKQLRKLA